MNNIRKIAKEKGIFLKTIEEDAELSYGYLAKLLKGNHSPSVLIAWKISTALGESIEKVFPRGEEL
jgi:transcriptional regulator with XRE-family HTH domain